MCAVWSTLSFWYRVGFLLFRWRFNIMAVASTARGAVTFVIKSAPSCPRWIGCVYNCGACVTKIHQLSVYTLLLWLNINSCARLPWPFWYQLFSAPVVTSPLLRAAWPRKENSLSDWKSARCGLYHYRPCCSLFMIPNPSLAVISSSLCIDHMAARSRAIDFIQAVAPECQGSSPVRLCAPLESHQKCYIMRNMTHRIWGIYIKAIFGVIGIENIFLLNSVNLLVVCLFGLKLYVLCSKNIFDDSKVSLQIL